MSGSFHSAGVGGYNSPQIISYGTGLSDIKVHSNTLVNSEPKKSLMNTFVSDIKEFVKEHRTIIYSVVVILLVDHFFLGNKLTNRIKGIVENLLCGVERKVSAATGAPIVVAATPVASDPA